MGKELSEQGMKNLIKLMAKQIPKYENAAKKEYKSCKAMP
jgi:hypothetical protein